jgi:signal transduction histidine kinase
MTIYDGRAVGRLLRRRVRPTLRLRLTLLNGALMVGGSLLLLFAAYVVAGAAVEAEIPADSRVTPAGGGPDQSVPLREALTSALGGALFGYGLLAVLVISAIAVTVAYVLAGRSLRPLQQVTSAAQHLSGETLDQRITYVGADDEVAELASTFDAMLDRINTTFETQKRFVANASHELRTPLAVMRTEIEVTLSDPEADIVEYRRMAKVVRDGSERANSLVDALLVLARSEAQAGRRLSRKQPADLVTGVVSAISAMRKEADRISLTITTDLREAPVVGDPGLLERLAGNLIENAVRYNHLHGSIDVRTGGDDEHSWLVVRNTGFEVEPADVPGLFEPFRRGGYERTGGRGSGLGLSIVRAVAEAHGGTVSAVANPEGGGLEVTVTLPSAAITPVVSATAVVPRSTVDNTPADPMVSARESAS